jgi:uncharacterized protein (DUF58 family)
MIASHALDTGFDPTEIAQIELHILRWMRESTTGDHASLATGNGFNLSGLKEWEPGDPVSTVDWAQSSLTNFSPLITRQFEQDSAATIIALADESRSTLCGSRGVRIQAAITRCLAAVGLAAAFYQDRFGFVGFDAGLRGTSSARPRPGKAHVLHCLELYHRHRGVDAPGFDVVGTVASFARRPGMLVVISDFLLPPDTALLTQLERLHATHDVLLMMIDATFAYDLPRTSAGWIEVFDVESGDTRVLSRRAVEQLRQRVADWQQDVAADARARGLDVVAVGLDRWHVEFALMQWVAERRLRKVSL